MNLFQKQFVMVPADKASNNIIIVCKKYYIQSLIDELGVFLVVLLVKHMHMTIQHLALLLNYI